MELQVDCIACNISQAIKVLRIIKIPKEQQKLLIADILKMLIKVDYNLCNPEVMKKTWDIICNYVNDKDPYQHIKLMYNQELLKKYDEFKKIILETNDPIITAMKMATLGNVIDFSANDMVELANIYKTLEEVDKTIFRFDDSSLFKKQLLKSQTIMYIGDNCGEIVLDKLFIEIIKQKYDCNIYYVVRENPIINDVTMIDAKLVVMDQVAKVISSGDSSLGLVLANTTKEFQKLFFESDMVIAKGQGNFEGLFDIEKDYKFHLFMVKCQVMEEILKLKKGSIVCLNK
jgi:Uncharacterized conserved protein